MVNFLTTIAGVCTRLINALIALAPWVSFAIWLEIRDLFYLVSTPSLAFLSCSCASKIYKTDRVLFRLRMLSVPVVVLEASCRRAIPVTVGSGPSSTRQHKAKRADLRAPGMLDLQGFNARIAI